MSDKISVLILTACCLSGCVSTRKYNRDMAHISKGFTAQLEVDKNMIDALTLLSGTLNEHTKKINEIQGRTILLESKPVEGVNLDVKPLEDAHPDGGPE